MSILDEARDLVYGDRNADYGHPRENHGATAALWNAYMQRRAEAGEPFVGPVDVCMLNALQKLSRFAWERKRDSLVDVVGYMLNAAICLGLEDLPASGLDEVIEQHEDLLDSLAKKPDYPDGNWLRCGTCDRHLNKQGACGHSECVPHG